MFANAQVEKLVIPERSLPKVSSSDKYLLYAFLKQYSDGANELFNETLEPESLEKFKTKFSQNARLSNWLSVNDEIVYIAEFGNFYYNHFRETEPGIIVIDDPNYLFNLANAAVKPEFDLAEISIVDSTATLYELELEMFVPLKYDTEKKEYRSDAKADCFRYYVRVSDDIQEIVKIESIPCFN